MSYSGNGSFIVVLIGLTVFASGCVSGGETNLDQDFDTGHTDSGLNSSAASIMDQSFSQDYSKYNISSEVKILMKTPVAPMRANLSSEGFYNKSRSSIKTVTKLGFGIGPELEKSQYPVKKVETYSNRTEVEIVNMEKSSLETFEPFSRKRLELSIAAIEEIEIENSTVIGVTRDNSSKIILKIQPNRTDLLENYGDVFKKHGISDNSTSIEEKDEFSGFEKVKAYAWIDRDSMRLERYSYFGSAAGKNLQVRADMFFRY